ncbi:MAG TPA: hypothetical protein VMG08_04560 [Allosphingosinicella sp.]|nr:hypothetical protein [Allosphingosinicella sp.]
MGQEPDWAAGDPEIAALLTFTPVPRRIARPDSWDPACQRGFIAWLAAEGNAITAAARMGRSQSGARQVRREDELGEFTAAWKGALALHRRRCNASPREPGAPPRLAWVTPAPAEPTDAELADHWDTFRNGILKTYAMKLCQEREARLRGCIVEADFYVRQLCWFDVLLDLGELGEKAVAMMRSLKRGDLDAHQIVATPVSLLLDHVRRSVWATFGEPERPPPPELGLHPGKDLATGGPGERTRGGPSEAEQKFRAEALALWEDKARQEAAAWRERLGLPPLAESEDENGGDDDDQGDGPAGAPEPAA